MPRQKVTNELCRICGVPNAITHFGAIACRACGAFFRRLSILDIDYGCSCEIEGQRLSEPVGMGILCCKGCRQQKCLDVGMKKKMVRAIGLREFHRKRQNSMASRRVEGPMMASQQCWQIGNLQQDNHPQMLDWLVEINNLVEKVHLFGKIAPAAYFDQFGSLESLLLDKKHNLIAHYEQIFSEPSPMVSNSELVEYVRQHGLFSLPIPNVATGLFICIHFARILPAFPQFQLLTDQVSLVAFSTIVALFLFANIYSAQHNSQALITCEGHIYSDQFSACVEKYSDKILVNAAEKIFIRPIGEFVRLDLRKHEIALLNAMLFSNSSIPGLSPQAQQILKAEEEKYGKMLLDLQQRWFGPKAGALRYMESLQLIWTAIGQAQRYRELATYIDSVHEQGKWAATLPRALHSLMT